MDNLHRLDQSTININKLIINTIFCIKTYINLNKKAKQDKIKIQIVKMNVGILRNYEIMIIITRFSLTALRLFFNHNKLHVLLSRFA